MLQMLSSNKKIIYIHIPFCEKKCLFCMYFSIGGCGESLKDKYLIELSKEFSKYRPIFNAIRKNTIAVHIGGGSPSSLTYEQLNFLFRMIQSRINFKYIKQFSIEVNPCMVRDSDYLKKLRLFKNRGITRISFGVQTFNERLYEMNNMSQTKDDIYNFIRDIKENDFKSYSFDLLLNIVGQNINDYYSSLLETINILPPHFALFNTQPTRSYKVRQISDADSERCFSVLNYIFSYKLGYIKLANNYAFDWSHFCFIEGGKFILDYDVIGLGVSSHSIFKEKDIVLVNPRSFKKYYSAEEEKQFIFEKKTRFSNKNLDRVAHKRIIVNNTINIKKHNNVVYNNETKYLCVIAEGIKEELNNNFDTAERLYNESAKFHNHYLAEFCLLSLKIKSRKKIDYRQINISMYPDLAKAKILYLLSRCYYQKKEIPASLHTLNEIMRYNPNDLNALSLLVLIYNDIDRKKARQYFDRIKDLTNTSFKNLTEFVIGCNLLIHNTRDIFLKRLCIPNSSLRIIKRPL